MGKGRGSFSGKDYCRYRIKLEAMVVEVESSHMFEWVGGREIWESSNNFVFSSSVATMIDWTSW